MELGIIGLPQSGKKSLYELLTGAKTSESGDKIIAGVANIRDERFDRLVRMYAPKKEVPAKINIQLFPKIESDSIKEGKIFTDISKMDALCHVVRAFKDDSIYHALGSVDPIRDISMINSELVMHDLIFIEKRFERIEAAKKRKPDPRLDAEEKLLSRMQAHLEQEKHLRTFSLSDEDKKLISGYPFITAKKMLIVLNVGDKDIKDTSLVSKVKTSLKELDIEVMQVSAKLEAEILSLDSDEEKLEFMEDAGIEEPALNILSDLAMKTLGLISFLLLAKMRCVSGRLRKGHLLLRLQGEIHSDIQRGFIRAEVMKYKDLIEYGNEEELKKQENFM